MTRAPAALPALLSLLVACGGGAGTEAGDYVTQVVDRGPIAATVVATGSVEPVTTVQVGTYVSGPIREILVDFNSPVTKGQLVARIDPAPFEVKVRQAEANLASAGARVQRARADLRFRELTLQRKRSLRAGEMISKDEFDTAESAHAQAVAQLAVEEAGALQAQASLEEARINLGYAEIRSPVDGVVVSRNVDVGQTVAASFQTPTLFEIAQDLTRMQVNVNVSESDIGAVREGQGAVFGVDAWPERAFGGRVVQVRNAPITVQNVVTYDVIVEVQNQDLALKPGMTATVTITTARRDDALRVPLSALRFRPEAAGGEAPSAAAPAPGRDEVAAVFVLDDGHALRRVELRTGLRDDRFAEVLAGEVEPGVAVAVALRSPAESEEPPLRSPFVPARR